MTDTLGAQAPAAPGQPPNQITSLVNDLATTLRSAPELKTAPGLAVPVAQAGGDITGNAQAVARTVHVQAQARAVKNVQASTHPGIVSDVLGFLGHAASDVAKPVEHVLGDVGSVMNKPLQFVQHEYRYLHDVEARHGIWAAIGEGVALTAGAVGAALLAPETGGGSLALAGTFFAGALGAEGTAAAAGQLAYHDSWNATTSPNYRDPNTHQLVSVGRDIAGAIGFKPGSTGYGLTQGIGNALFDLSLDPVVKGGQLGGVLRAGVGVISDGKSVVQAVDSSRTLQKSFDYMAQEKSARAISQALPQFKALAPELAKASTRDEVTKVFQRELELENLKGHRLPVLSFTALPIEKLRSSPLLEKPVIRSITGPIIRGQTPLAQVFDKSTRQFTNKNFDPADPSTGVAIYHWLRGSGQDHVTASNTADAFLATDNEGLKRDIWRNSIYNAVKAGGMTKRFLGRDVSKTDSAAWDDPEFQRRLMGKFENVAGGGDPNHGLYAHGPPGAEHIPGTTTKDGYTIQSAILDSQVGKFSFPNPQEMRKAMAQVAGAKGYYGMVDDFLYDKITYPIFKRWILMTGSFATHVGLSEAILEALRQGTFNMLRSRGAVTLGKMDAAGTVYTKAATTLGVKGTDFLRESDALAKSDRALTKAVGSGDLTEAKKATEATKLLNESAARLGVKPADLTQALGDISKVPRGTALGRATGTSLTRWYTVRAMRYGGDDAVNSVLHDPEEQKALGAFMYHVLKGRVHDANRSEVAMMLGLYNRGHIVSPGISAGHTAPYNEGSINEFYTSAMRDGARRIRYRGTDDFSSFLAGQEGQTRAWQQWLNSITKDPASARGALVYKAALDRGLSPEAAHQEGAAAATLFMQDHPENHGMYTEAQNQTDAPGWENMDPLTAWGHKKMLNVRGATTGIDGTIHNDLLDAIVSGHFKPRGGEPSLPNSISRDYLESLDAKPSKTLGREYLPDPTGTMERIATYGHDHVLSPIINFLSREPTYVESVYRHYKTLKGAVLDGRLTEEDALTKAQTWATQDMIKFVHNIHEKTQLSETLRNYAPFWFAQQQAYKRVGRLLATDPGAFRKYQLIVTQLHDMGNQSKGANGTNYITFPGSGFLSAGSVGILNGLGMPVTGSSPVSFSGSLDSMSFIMPGAAGFRPDFGPLVALPVKAIAMMFPELQPAGNAAIGGMAMNASIWDQLIPNAFMNRVLVGLGASSRSFNSTFMATIQNLDYQQTVAMTKWEKDGHKGPQPDIVPPPTAGPVAQQAFLNKVRNQTRIMYMIRAALGLMSPLSPQLKVQNYGFPAELTAAIAKEGSVSGGVSAFLIKHPDATPYTVFQSTQATGSQYPASVEAENWIHDNAALIAQYPYASAWLMPQLADTKYNPAIYNEQLAQGTRAKRTPQDFLNALYIAAGNYQYYNLDRPAYEKDLASGQFDNSSLRSQFSAFTKTLGAQNPIWYDDFQSADRATRRQQTISELQTMLTGPTPPQGQMADGIRGLLKDYQTYTNGIVQKLGSATALSDAFHAYLLGVAKDQPELAPVILSVFGPATSVYGSSFASAAQAAGVAP